MTEPNKYGYTWRATFAQVVAMVAFHTMMLNVGLIIAMPSVLIGALMRRPSTDVDEDPTHRMTFTDGQASWFGSLLFVTQPLGSVLSGALQERLGRKRCLLLVNAFQLVAWVVMCRATSVAHLFAGLVILGLTIGFEEAPVLSYLGEVTEPRLRGLASSSGGVFFNLGLILETGLGYAHARSDGWRTMLRVATVTPIFAFLAISLVPESPTWLVSKGRTEDARRAYQWLRGWLPPASVQAELDDTIEYVRDSHASATNGGRDKESQLQLFLSPSVQRPLRLIVIFFFISCCTALIPLRPFIIPFLERLNSPVDAFKANMLGSVLSLAGALTAGAALPWLGKRRLAFASLAVCVSAVAGLSLCLAASRQPPPDFVLLLLGLVAYSSSCGVLPVPWILISELFPLRAKGLASGVAAAAGYLVLFLMTGAHHWLVSALSDWGALLAYGSVGLPGALYLYLVLPETEGVPLEITERLMDGAAKGGVKSGEEETKMTGEGRKAIDLLDVSSHDKERS